jgi:aspartate-semialdehyde dehydrogenase
MMGADFHFRDKVQVGILGATGSVGQKLVQMLARHPWFMINALAASERSVGKKYKDCVHWLMPTLLPQELAEMEVSACQPGLPCRVVFSGLDSSVAGEIETQFAEAGYIVISNSRNHRMDPDVPLLIPEVNLSHLELIQFQQFPKGKIITNPNCSVIGLAMALKPLFDRFGLEAVHAVTMQAISGAGYPGVASLDIQDNIIPFIQSEEEKVETELLKILGKFQDGKIDPCSFKISAQCNRVPVSDGHTACVSVKLKSKATEQDLIEAWDAFSGAPEIVKLPTAPEKPLYYFHENYYPQPKLHRLIDKGMAVSIGRLRKCPLFDFKFTLLSHNTVRGAAGGAILNAEILLRQGQIFW